MGSRTFLEFLGHVMFSFTRSVTDHYNPEEPEYTAESFGYSPLESTGREWYYHPVDELIYQEYSDREIINTCYLAASSLDVRVTNACSVEENEGTPNREEIDRRTAWKRLRPSFRCTVWKSMYFGGLISLLSAIVTGTVYMLISYLCYKTVNLCEFSPPNRTSIPERVQWMRTLSAVIAYIVLYNWFFSNALFLFRIYQLKGLKMKLFVSYCIFYCMDAGYRVTVQALGISYSKLSVIQKIPTNVLFLACFGFQVHFFNKTVLCTASKTENISVPPIVSARFSYIYSSPYFHPLYLSRIYQRKQRRQTCYRFVRASNRSFA